MVPEHWQLGEDVQDTIRRAGYESETVEGIAVDLHDLLQAADRIRVELAPVILAAQGEELARLVGELKFELEHIRWHCESAERYLSAASAVL
jgi:hypothetical protein